MPHPARRKRKEPLKGLVSAQFLLDFFANLKQPLQRCDLGWQADLRIHWPERPNEPYRDIRRVVKYKTTYYLSSHKNKRTVACESNLEFLMATLLEANPQVTSFIEQPFLVTWKDQAGIHHKHIPDFLARFRNGMRLLIEVKPDSALNELEINERTQLIQSEFSRDSKFHYVMIIESQILGTTLENAKAVLRYPRIDVNPHEIEALRVAFSGAITPPSIESLCNSHSLNNLRDLESKILGLIRLGYINFDMEFPFNSRSPLFWI